ncbi:hypothetical protein ASD97_08980 [Streptomyces sp. Root63]|uniref:DUF6193 family natural product biosynthesis protein n=1 Tax=Streptomyces TaxID=1883 RepID=UPI0006F601A4|nr:MULTISPECIES: DUF6193 family natural product biosynthesis protein [Streptomyces]MDF9805310.1 hypothetical protein [Streptomyces sp. HB372]KQX37178.1 hypothetical protein ASD29_08245 [Streptomyces sp. Root1295]KRA43755.1 hypothetical protein ASD97_08980 [Streptomyces sp. Root63]MBT1099263.1 hypothetical protein [Streptomyces sp. Tu10]WUC87912.1 DUF6193 family natural product biosynthesis protein [Streptomyces anulatus]
MTNDEALARAAEIVATEWKDILDSEDGLIDPAMPRAAYANPRLRELFPTVSHGALYLSRCIRHPRPHDVGSLFPRAGGGFMVVRQSDGTVLGEPETVEEAVALIAAHLPEGCGPAIDGSANDL